MPGIYKITNLINNKSYIGKSETSVESRLMQHKIGYNSNNHLQNSIKKYGIENFSFDILENCSKEDCCERERFWIRFFKSSDSRYGYNKTSGGENSPGWTMSDESKSKMRKPKSKEHRENISKSLIGNSNSKKYFSIKANRDKLSSAIKASYKNPVTINKKKEANDRRWNNVDEHIKMSIAQKKRWDSLEKERQRNLMKGNTYGSGRIWVTDGTATKMVYPDELAKYLSKGWRKGRIIKKSDATTIES